MAFPVYPAKETVFSCKEMARLLFCITCLYKKCDLQAYSQSYLDEDSMEGDGNLAQQHGHLTYSQCLCMGLSNKGLQIMWQLTHFKDTQTEQYLYLPWSGRILLNWKHFMSARQKGLVIYHASVLLQTMYNSQHLNSCSVWDGSMESYKTNCIPNTFPSPLHILSLTETLIFKVITLTQLYYKGRRDGKLKTSNQLQGKCCLFLENYFVELLTLKFWHLHNWFWKEILF